MLNDSGAQLNNCYASRSANDSQDVEATPYRIPLVTGRALFERPGYRLPRSIRNNRVPCGVQAIRTMLTAAIIALATIRTLRTL
jgi:hypothetical protein